MQDHPIYVVGLGAMGFPMAMSLLRGGKIVIGIDRNPDIRARFSKTGAKVYSSAGETAEAIHALLVVVVNDQQAEEVLFGAGAAADKMPEGAVVILSLTTAPEAAVRIGRRLAQRGIHMVDCPVSGGVKRAASGTLTILASATPEAIRAASPYLDCLGKTIVIGAEHGQASQAKLLNQILCGVHLVAAAEVVALAQKAGIDPSLVHQAIVASSGNSFMFSDRVPKMLTGSEAVGAAISILRKDLTLACAFATKVAARTPLARQALSIFDEAAASGLDTSDDSEILKLFRIS